MAKTKTLASHMRQSSEFFMSSRIFLLQDGDYDSHLATLDGSSMGKSLKFLMSTRVFFLQDESYDSQLASLDASLF